MRVKIALLAFVVIGLFILLAFLWVTHSPQYQANRQSAELQQNYQKWLDLHITHYRFSIWFACICEINDRTPLTIEVLNNKVASVTDKDGEVVSHIPSQQDDVYNPIADYAKFFTIDGIVLYAEAALSGAYTVNIKYDPNLGIPILVGADWDKNTIDDEFGLEVSNFEVVP